MHPSWLSNAYLVADEEGGRAVCVDSRAPLEPLHDAVERHGLTVTHLLTTHADADHIAGDDELRSRYGLEIVKGPLETGGLRFEALETPGHKDDHLTFLANGEAALTGDVLFKDAVGGGNFAQIRDSVMSVLMKLPRGPRLAPRVRARAPRARHASGDGTAGARSGPSRSATRRRRRRRAGTCASRTAASS